MDVCKAYSKMFGKMSFTTLVLLAFLAGCGGGPGDDGGGGGGGPLDFTAPTVTAMTPGQDSSGVPTNSKLTAAFSEAMIPALVTLIDPATNNPANFRLATGANYLPGTVSYDATNHIAVFTPAGGLAPNTGFTATIITGVKDLGGNPITIDFAWDFVTGGTADNTAPDVISTFPIDAATGVPINRKISATFSQDMDTSTITPANFTVTGPGPTPVSGAVVYLRKTAVFTPSSGLAANTTYRATIGTGVMSLAGNASQANATWSFTTGANADVAAPVVVSTSPARAESGVAIGRAVNIRLSEPMDPATISTANFLVFGPGTAPVIGIVAFDATSNTAIFTRQNHLTTPPINPVINFEPNTTYTATLTTGAKDMSGNALASNFAWTFTTGP